MPGNVERDIGALLAQVRGITETLSKQDQSRANLHKRVDDLKSDFFEMKSGIGQITKDVQDSKVVTDEVKRWKQRGMGALAVVGLGGTAFGVVISDAVQKFVSMLAR